MLHHDHVVGDLTHHGEIVRDEQVGEPLLGLQVVEQMQHLILHEHIQGGDGLIADNDVGVERHGSCDGDALALTA